MNALEAVRQFYRALVTGDVSLLDDILDPNWEEIPAASGANNGVESHRPAVAWLHSVFPDLDITNEEFVVAGDHVAVRSVTTGTHSADLLGVPATGRKVEFRQFDFHELRDGRIVKTWHLGDFFALAQQIGALAALPDGSGDR